MIARRFGRGRRWPAAAGQALLVFALYLGAAAAATWPLITQLDSRLVGHPFGDTTEYTRHIWWIHESLRDGTLSFFTPNPLLLYPDGLTAAWLWSAPLQSFPQWLLLDALPLPVAHNLVALVTLALNGLAMWGLVGWLLREPLTPRPPLPRTARRDSGSQGEGEDAAAPSSGPLKQKAAAGERSAHLPSPVERGTRGEVSLAAVLAGLVFALYPAFQGQLGAGHTGLLVLWPLPLYILALMRAANNEGRPWRWIAAAGALFAVSQWGNLLLLLYAVLPFTALYLLTLLVRRRWRGLGRALAAVALGGLLSLPFALPTLRDVTGGAVAQEDGVVRFSASLLTIAAPSFYNPLYSGLTFNRTILGQDPFEGAGYIGWAAALLALIAAVRVKRARFWLLLAALAWIASLGPLLKVLDSPVSLTADGHPSYVALPWALVQNLPVLNIIRTPVRFNFTVGLAIAVLVGYGAAVFGGWLARRWSARLAAGILAAIGLVIAIDYQWFAPMPTIPAEVPAPVRALGDDPAIRAVFDLPWSHLLTDKDALYLQTGHGLPLIGGHVTRRTPLDPARATLLQETLDPYLLDAAGVDVIILHRQWDADPAARAARLIERFGPPLYDDERIAVWRVAHDPAAAPAFVQVDALTGALADQGHLYFYAPADGQAELSLTLASGEPRALTLALDGRRLEAPFTAAPFEGEASFTVALEFAAGFHTLTLALDPACPPEPYPTLACAAVEVSAVTLDAS